MLTPPGDLIPPSAGPRVHVSPFIYLTCNSYLCFDFRDWLLLYLNHFICLIPLNTFWKRLITLTFLDSNEIPHLIEDVYFLSVNSTPTDSSGDVMRAWPVLTFALFVLVCIFIDDAYCWWQPDVARHPLVLATPTNVPHVVEYGRSPGRKELTLGPFSPGTHCGEGVQLPTKNYKSHTIVNRAPEDKLVNQDNIMMTVKL
jgi:hypothetical protein